jgi:alkaline phosphatase D
MAAHASAPWIATWDDHEVDNNYAGDFDQDGTPPEIFALRRAAAYQAYYEAMPLRASALPSGSHMRIYRRLQFGSLIDLSVLDTRQWRSDQPCGDGGRTGCEERLAPTQTMMGPEQEKWLFDNLATAKARWTVIGQQVYSFAFDRSKANPAAQFSMDKWDGYVAARQRLYTRLVETKAPNPIVLSGDVHQHYGADLKMDFTDPRSATIGVEFTNTSVTTNGDGGDVGTTWEATRGDNPHIRYHSNRRGYIACTATPAEMRADFMILDKVSVPDLPARVGGSLVVHAGRPGSNTD